MDATTRMFIFNIQQGLIKAKTSIPYNLLMSQQIPYRVHVLPDIIEHLQVDTLPE